jgi:uncharacterized protein with HEPN domain
MPKSDWVYLGHMLDMCQKGLEISAGKTRRDYDQSVTLQFALVHVIQVIGEAADHISDEFKERYPQVSWFEIIGMRHRIVHDYMNVDEDVVWSVVENDLPSLLEILKKIIPLELQ